MPTIRGCISPTFNVIHNPVAEVYTNPVSAELTRAYYADVGAFERAAARAAGAVVTQVDATQKNARV